MNNELEIYSPIEGFPNYLVTSHGRVLSLNYHRQGKIKELKQMDNTHGYLNVILNKNNKRYAIKVHRLVAQAFIPNPENKPCINHIDENKTNNHVSNLEWVTHKENNIHGTRIKRMITKNSKSIIGFKINGCDIKYYKSMSDCKNDNFDLTAISKCCYGIQKSHKGYKWYFSEKYFNKTKGDENLS